MLLVYQISFSMFLSKVFKHYGVDVETTIAWYPSNKIEEIAIYKMMMVKRGD